MLCDSDMMWEGMVPGSVVVALAIENVWAVKFINSSGTCGRRARDELENSRTHCRRGLRGARA